jgi:hypothetical protein
MLPVLSLMEISFINVPKMLEWIPPESPFVSCAENSLLLRSYMKKEHFPSICSNSCTSLNFKTLKSHTKTLKIRPYMFRSPLKPSSGVPWPYYVTELECWFTFVIKSGYLSGLDYLSCLDQIGIHTHTHRRNELTYSHIPTLFITNVNQHSNSVT